MKNPARASVARPPPLCGAVLLRFARPSRLDRARQSGPARGEYTLWGGGAASRPQAGVRLAPWGARAVVVLAGHLARLSLVRCGRSGRGVPRVLVWVYAGWVGRPRTLVGLGRLIGPARAMFGDRDLLMLRGGGAGDGVSKKGPWSFAASRLSWCCVALVWSLVTRPPARRARNDSLYGPDGSLPAPPTMGCGWARSSA